MVEMMGVEPMSENKSIPASTSLGYGRYSRYNYSTTKVIASVVSLVMICLETAAYSRSPPVFALFRAAVLADKTAALIRQRMLIYC